MMQALTANQPATVSGRATNAGWAKPERGFDDWTLQEDLAAADRVLAALERDRAARFEPGPLSLQGKQRCSRERLQTGSGQQDPAKERPSHPGSSPGACALRYLLPVGSAALLVGASLLVGSFFSDRGELWDGGLTVIVIGQTALLLASLAPSR